MIYLEYGRDLPNKVNKKNDLPHEFETFTHWHVKPIKINNKECYLLMEHDTKFWVILTKLNEHLFRETLRSFLLEQTCIVPSLVKELFYSLDGNFSYVRNDLINERFFQINRIDTDFYTDELNTLEKNFSQLVENEALEEDISLLYTRESYKLNKKSDNIIRRTEFMIAFYYVMDSKLANKNVKYVDIKPNFKDPRDFEEVEFSFLDEISSSKQKAIRQNNLKLIDQFSSYYPSDNKKYLTDFLNVYLFHPAAKLVTTDLSSGSYFLWHTSKDVDLVDENNAATFFGLKNTLVDFYRFLKRCGIINQNNYRNAESCIDEQTTKLIFILKQKALLKMIKELSQESTTTDTAKPKASKPTTYKIRAKLRDFKPATWRTFTINGNSSLSELMAAVILMFHGELYHLFNIHPLGKWEPAYTPEDQLDYESLNTFEVADDHTISELKLGKKYQIDYDYGGSWEFVLHVKEIIEDQNPPTVPQIINGKGYGIIEDIGGTTSLQAIYNYQNGKKLDSEYKEFISDIKSYNEELLELDLASFDKAEVQGLLTELFDIEL